MAKRSVITIDRDRCTGCGQCVNACIGGALELVDGKAKLVREDYCDGLGVCVGECPVGALTVEERDAAPMQAGASAHADAAPAPAAPQDAVQDAPGPGHACPAFAQKTFVRAGEVAAGASALEAWPIQLHLVRPIAPQFSGADVLLAASCTAFASGEFHKRLLAGRGLVIACPKLDRKDGYDEKLRAFFAEAQPKSVTVARMEVPCCTGLVQMALAARDAAGSALPVREVVIALDGRILDEVEHPAPAASAAE